MLEQVVQRAEADPAHPAAKDVARELDFAGLVAEVGRVAAGLAGSGVSRQDRVALHLPNSVDFIVASLACNWIGAVFVPLAASDPPARVRAIVEDCDPSLVVMADPADTRSGDHGDRPFRTVADLGAGRGPVPERSMRPEDDAYCIYTSGTTGVPKGVMVGGRAFAHAVRAALEAFGLGPHTRALCVAPFHFDGSFGTVFPTLAAGGSLVIPDRESLLLPRVFVAAVEREGINHTSCSPSYLRRLLDSRDLPRLARTELRTLGLGGEECLEDDLRRLWAAVPGLRVFNRYGPTEAVIAVTSHELRPSELTPGGRVPIGAPHPGVIFRLVSGEGTLVSSPGEPGELYIGGEQLMSGYWNDPELTAEVMRDDIVAGERLYRTGDLVYRDQSGAYVYLDRTDRVVKRRGVRISLAEMAMALRQLDGVVEAVCVPFLREGRLHIAAFLVASRPLEVSEVRAQARAYLPTTMLPDVVEQVSSLPLTSTGKIDERTLVSRAGLLGTPGFREGT